MSKTTWERTSVQNLLRNGSSGRYYARWTIAGKQKWVNLKTDVFSVAKLRIIEESGKIEAVRQSGAAVTAGKGTMSDLIRVYEESLKENTELKPSSITARKVALKKLLKTWPNLEELKPSQITPGAIQDWARRFKAEGTNYTPPGAKTVIKGNSATSVNRAIDTLRRLMDIAVNRGAIHSNPVNVEPEDGKSLRKKVGKTVLRLPSNADVLRIIESIEKNGAVGGWSVETADFCRFLAYTGCRVGEVQGVTWECINWEKKTLHIRGVEQANPEHKALKTESSDRHLPLFADLEALLQKLIERRKKAAVFSKDGVPMIAPTDRVLRISECQKSIDAACAKLGIERITHHDFRHLFATRCIEAGVDIPTVSRWLGHSDGGTLAMKTYGHLRQDHSQAQAAKVKFGAAA